MGKNTSRAVTDLGAFISDHAPTEMVAELQAAIRQDLVETSLDRSAGEAPQIALTRRFYEEKVRTGVFEGLPQLTWNGRFEEENLPRFLYLPNPDAPFRFRSPSLDRWIEPGPMDTDGGSTPSLLWSIKSLSPWYYGAAAVLHDWIVTAHRCRTAPDAALTLEQAAMVAAEAMKTLMEEGICTYDRQIQRYDRKPHLVYLVYKANTSSKARAIWQNDDRGRICRPPA